MMLFGYDANVGMCRCKGDWRWFGAGGCRKMSLWGGKETANVLVLMVQFHNSDLSEKFFGVQHQSVWGRLCDCSIVPHTCIPYLVCVRKLGFVTCG